MRGRTVLLGLAVLIAASGLGFYAGKSDRLEPTGSLTSTRPTLLYQPVTQVEAEEAERQRQVHYADISSIAQILALPTDFAQSEATYVLAGRAGVSELRAYIAEAERIANRNDRRAALGILYSRYGEIDPQGALAHLDQSKLDIKSDLAGGIVGSWAKLDQDAAISAANAMSTLHAQRTAGDAILRAHSEEGKAVLESIAARLTGPVNLERYSTGYLAAIARTDPRAAISEALDLEQPTERQRAIYWIADIWARSDGAGAYQHASQIADPQMREQFRAAVLGRWAQHDPQSVFGLAERGDLAPNKKRQVISISMAALGASDPLQAIDLAQRLTSSGTRDQALQAVFQGWAQRDPESAAMGIEQISNLSASSRRSLAGSVAAQYAQRSPQEALAWARRVDGHGNLWRTVLKTTAARDPHAALNAAMAVESDGDRHQAISSVIGVVAQSQPDVAVGYLDQIPAGAAKTAAITQVVHQWSRQDPAAAFEWAQTLPAGDTHTKAMQSIVRRMVRHDPELAASYVGRIGGPARQHWITTVAGSLVNTDPQRALNWIAQFRDEPGHDAALTKVVQSWAASDPQAALGIAGQIDSAPNRANAVRMIAQRWAQSDPAAAARWVSNQPGDARAPMIGSVAQLWAQHDQAAARQWVLGLESGPGRDAGLVAMVGQISGDPRVASDLIARISSDEHRMAAIQQHVVRRLGQQDPAGAAAFIDGVSVSEEQRVALEQLMQRIGRASGY